MRCHRTKMSLGKYLTIIIIWASLTLMNNNSSLFTLATLPTKQLKMSLCLIPLSRRKRSYRRQTTKISKNLTEKLYGHYLIILPSHPQSRRPRRSNSLSYLLLSSAKVNSKLNNQSNLTNLLNNLLSNSLNNSFAKIWKEALWKSCWLTGPSPRRWSASL